MSKSIKLEDQVYQELEAARGKRETFSQAVSRLISFYREVNRAAWGSTGEKSQTGEPGGKMAPIKS